MRKLAITLLLAACNSTPPNTALTDAQKTAATLAAFRDTLESKDFGAIAQNYPLGAQQFVRATVPGHAWVTDGPTLGDDLDSSIQGYISHGTAATDLPVKEACEEGISHVILRASFEQVYAAAALDTAAGWDTAFGLYGDSGGTATGLGALAIERDTEFGLANEAAILAAFSAGRAAVARGQSGADSLATLDNTMNTVFGLSLRHEFAEAAANVVTGDNAAALEGYVAGEELWQAQVERLKQDHASEVTAVDVELSHGNPTDASLMTAVDFNKLVNTVTALFNLTI